MLDKDYIKKLWEKEIPKREKKQELFIMFLKREITFEQYQKQCWDIREC
jgi:hypothetical protein